MISLHFFIIGRKSAGLDLHLAMADIRPHRGDRC
jgi:hypothetical protein